MSIFHRKAQPASSEGIQPSTTQDQIEEKPAAHLDQDPFDMENQKQAAVELGEEGAFRTELMQEVWGKYGKMLIFARYDLLA